MHTEFCILETQTGEDLGGHPSCLGGGQLLLGQAAVLIIWKPLRYSSF